MKISKIFGSIIMITLVSCGGAENSLTPTTTIVIPLKKAASFPIGMIVSTSRISGSDTNFRTILNKEFNSITAEYEMKMASIFTGANTYDFSKGDAIVAYAKANGIRVHGHALVWHSSIPSWLQNYSGTDAEFGAQVKGYIKTTVAHFALEKTASGKSVVESWDVVNEAFTDAALNAVFYKRIGPNYVAKCFTWAREADATVKLFYNDYNLESDNTKVVSVIDMVNTFKANSTPIDGIGLQMHIDYQYPSLSTMTDNLAVLKSTGLLIHFSELDMTVNKDKVLSSMSSDRANAQKAKYKEIAVLYKTIPAAQRFGITFWGMRDTDSWLISFYSNTNEWPLLFDANYGYKAAYTGFLEGLQL